MGEFDDPQQRQRHTHIEQPLSRGSLRYDEQQQYHYQYSQQHPQQFQHSEYHPREVPIYFRPLQGSAASLPPPSYPFPQHTGPSSSHPRHRHHPTTTRQEPSQSHQRWRQTNPPPPPFPPTALRIPVNNKDVSLGTFQVILQYIYTGSIGLSEGQIHDIDKYWNHYPEEQITPQGDKNLLDDEDMPSLSSLLAYFHARERAEKSRSGGDNGSGGARIEPRPPILLPPPGPEFVDERSNEGSTVGSGAPEDRRRSYSTIKDLLAAGDMYTFTTASVQTAWIPCSPRNRRKEFRDPQPYPAPACHHEEPAREEEEEGEESQTGGHDSDSGLSGHRQGQGLGGCRSGGNRGSTGQHGASIGSDRGEAASSISNPEDNSPSLATTTTDTLLHPPNRHLLIHHIRPTCSWESLLLAANLFRLHDLETTALKAIKYHCQMLASRAMINNNVMAEVAHNGFDRSNLDLQLALGERIMLSLLKLYRSSGLRFHPEGVQVVRGGGEGGIESKGLQYAQRESFAIHSRLGERFRRQSEGQQEKQGEDKEKGGDDDDDEKQEEGRLGTIQPSSSSSSAAMTHGSSSGGAGSRRYSAHRQSRVGHQAPQDEGFTATASGGGSSGGRGGRGRSTEGPFRAGSRGSLAERAEEKEEHREVEQEEGDEEEDTVASPLELFNHPECENALEALCKDLRERFMSMREVMDHRHRQGGNRAA
ncbi:MAG: hypothetical protein J3R72DRAFT_427156 [Linnemannia gamsii]|nr:MAG: hypothetical protein J3R72DRAFT_427156 [Linnemannia gamsii]